jgi:hypothetical protein
MLQTLLAAVVLAAPAPETPLPTGPAPQLAVVRLNSDGNLVQRVTVEVAKEVLREIKKTIDGREVVVQQKFIIIEQTFVDEARAGKGLAAFDATGKQVPADRLPGLLAKDTLVLISADGNKLDPAYLRVIKDGTLVLVLPRQTVPPEKLPKLP